MAEQIFAMHDFLVITRSLTGSVAYRREPSPRSRSELRMACGAERLKADPIKHVVVLVLENRLNRCWVPFDLPESRPPRSLRS
jgi:hypothetical protein